MVSKNQQKIGKANGMSILPTGPTGHENGKCGFCGHFQGGPSVHIWPQGQGNALRGS